MCVGFDDYDISGWVLVSEVGNQRFTFSLGTVIATNSSITVVSGRIRRPERAGLYGLGRTSGTTKAVRQFCLTLGAGKYQDSQQGSNAMRAF